ncbi:hypothetical protein BMT55_00060 [Listeria newyorkensis]|uniref:Phage replisome organiser N-terminal domain-containing protein n=1 Tax=Listeria newyorkensis TaxID=1497681 RepID=A0ABX4XS85_9LIST|nr:phage replisome organizer N-terminal domain-containing protein [Listeria newyorkensis]PNP94786.1 hypothetical protein BMT55_00060 [Listeria newyorkensis]
MTAIKWIKLTVNMFDDEKIKIIEKMPEGDQMLLIWIRLLSLAGKTNDKGRIYLEENVPYTEDMLAVLFNRDVGIVRVTLQALRQFKMIQILDDGRIEIENWEKHQNVDGMDKIRLQTRERVKKHRKSKGQNTLADNEDSDSRTCNVTGNKDVTPSNATDIELDKEKESDKEPRKKDFNEEHLKLAHYFFSRIEANQPGIKPPRDFGKWAKTIRLMMEKDQRTTEQIRWLIEWVQQDDFEMMNVRSPTKLRARFDDLVFKVKKQKELQQKKATPNKQEATRRLLEEGEDI